MNAKKIIIGSLAAAIILAGGGIFYAKARYEQQAVNDVRRLFAAYPHMNLQAENIQASFFDKKLRITGITGSYTANGVNVDVKIAGIVTTDLADADTLLARQGAYKVYSGLELNGLVVTMRDLGIMTLDSYSIKDMTADVQAIVSQIQKIYAFVKKQITSGEDGDDRENEAMSLLEGYVQAQENTHIGKATLNGLHIGLKLGDDSLRVTLAKSETSDYSQTHSGPSSMEKLAFSHNGKTILNIAAAGLDSMDFPNSMFLLQEMQKIDAGIPDYKKIYELFKEKKLNVGNFRINNLIVANPASPQQTVSLGTFTLNMSNASPIFVAVALDGLDLDKSILPEDTLSDAQLALLPDTLSFSGAFDLSLTEKTPLNFGIICKPFRLSEKKLGSLDLSFDLGGLNVINLLSGNPGNLSLNNLHVTVNDGIASEIAFASLMEEKGGQEGSPAPQQISTAPMREHYAGLLLRQAHNLPEGPIRELAANAAAFIKTPGGMLNLAMNPPKPLDRMSIISAFVMSPDLLGLSSSFAPGK